MPNVLTTDSFALEHGGLSPTYFDQYPAPEHPDDPALHRCIGMRMGTGGIYHRELERDEVTVRLAADWSVLVSEAALAIEIAEAGGGHDPADKKSWKLRAWLIMAIDASCLRNRDGGRLHDLSPFSLAHTRQVVAHSPDQPRFGFPVRRLGL